MTTAVVTQIAYAVQTLFDPAGTVGRLVDLGKLANYGLLTSFTPAALFTDGVNGAWYDPSDIKLNWRRNLLTETEFRNGLIDAPTRGGLISATTLNGYQGAIAFGHDGVTGSYAYKSISITALTTYNISVVVEMSDGLAPTFGSSFGSDSANDFVFVVAAAAVSPITYSVKNFGGTLYRVSATYTAPGAVYGITVGIVKYATNSSRTFKVSAYQLEQGSTATPYQRITDGIQDYLQYQAQPALYQDAAGTTPVTAVEQPVGRMLDKSGRGNHAFNGSGNSANFPVLSARYNLLTKTEQFDDAVWTKAGGTNYANSTTAPDGTQTGALFIENTVSGTHGYSQATSSIPSGVSAKYTIRLKYHSRRYVRVAWVTDGGAESVYVDVDLIAGVVVNQGPYGVSTTQTSASITSAGLGWYTVEIKGTLPSATTYATVYARNSSTNSNPESAFGYVGDGASGFYIWGADLRVANDGVNLPAYQRVNTATDYDTVGFKPYLRFNGVNSWLQTNSIDFTYGDKVFFCAGVRKLNDAASGIAVELSASVSLNNGSFLLYAPFAAGDYRFSSKGTLQVTRTLSPYSAPITNVFSGIADVAGKSLLCRINGAPAGITGAADQGTGNYGNYPLYIGARAGSSLFFNGRLYGMVVAGKQASAAEITATETFINQKTGAY